MGLEGGCLNLELVEPEDPTTRISHESFTLALDRND
jgi:hypothetical protein